VYTESKFKILKEWRQFKTDCNAVYSTYANKQILAPN